MRLSRRMWVLPLVAVVAFGGCGTAEEPEPGPSPTTVEPAPDPEPEPEPEPEPPAEGPTDRSDPELGIVFEDLPEVTGDARSVVDAVTLFEVEAWRSMSEGVMAPEVELIASPEMVSLLQAQLDGNREGGWAVGGTLEVAVEVDTATESTAVAIVCQDWDEVTFTRDGVTESDAGERYRFEVPLTRSAGPWVVDYYHRSGTC